MWRSFIGVSLRPQPIFGGTESRPPINLTNAQAIRQVPQTAIFQCEPALYEEMRCSPIVFASVGVGIFSSGGIRALADVLRLGKRTNEMITRSFGSILQ